MMILVGINCDREEGSMQKKVVLNKALANRICKVIYGNLILLYDHTSMDFYERYETSGFAI